MITSKTNNQIKNIRKLLESARARRDQKLFVAEGERITSEVPKHLVSQIYVSEDYPKQKEDSWEVIAADVFRNLSDTVHPQGILAVLKQPEYQLEELLLNENPDERSVFVILDDVRDPGNLGTIVRTSEAAGVKGIIMSPGCADIFNPKVVRSTMGSIFRVPFVTADITKAITLLKKAGYDVYGSSLEAGLDFRQVSYGKRIAFITGNEANGISREVLEQTTQNIYIPMKGKIESLNAAVSLAVLLYHVI